MSEKDKSGSNADTGDTKNKTAKVSMDELLVENEQMRHVIAEKDSIIADLTKQLQEANNILEGQQKSKLISEIIGRSNFKMDDLIGKSVEDLQNIRATLEQAVYPKVNSVRYGVLAADVSDRELGLTVGDLSIVTAQKRKAQGVA